MRLLGCCKWGCSGQVYGQTWSPQATHTNPHARAHTHTYGYRRRRWSHMEASATSVQSHGKVGGLCNTHTHTRAPHRQQVILCYSVHCVMHSWQ